MTQVSTGPSPAAGARQRLAGDDPPLWRLPQPSDVPLQTAEVGGDILKSTNKHDLR